MTRYEKVKEILDNLPKESLRECPSKNPCACTGCVTSKGIRKSELEWYIKQITIESLSKLNISLDSETVQSATAKVIIIKNSRG